MEIWKPCTLSPLYEISDLGRARRGGRILSPQLSRGYAMLSVALGKRNKRRLVSIHREVAALFIGPPPAGHEVNHKDGDKLNNAATNLEYLTKSDNTLHAYRIGLMQNGSGRPGAKLTEDQARAIRQTYCKGIISYATLAKQFNVSERLVRQIVSGKKWKHCY